MTHRKAVSLFVALGNAGFDDDEKVLVVTRRTQTAKATSPDLGAVVDEDDAVVAEDEKCMPPGVAFPIDHEKLRTSPRRIDKYPLTVIGLPAVLSGVARILRLIHPSIESPQ